MEEFNITKEQYKELTDYILALKLRIQDLEDIIINDISAINISDDAIEGRHIGSTEINISKLDIDLDDISDGDTYGKVYASALEEGLALLSEAAGDLDDIQDGTYGKVLTTNITAGKIVLAQCEGSLDNIANGVSYGKVNLTAITAGNILLSTCSGSMDDIDDGETYGKVLGTSLSESAILLSAALGNLDNIDDGASYGKVAVTDISSGHIKLSECEGGLDNISDGATYGKVAITDISSGHIDLAFCVGDLDDIANGTSYAKVALTSISAGKIIVAGLDSGITARMFTDSTTQTNIEAWKHATDVTKIDGGDIYTNSITANAIAAGTITATEIHGTTLSAISANLGTITAGSISAVDITIASTYGGSGVLKFGSTLRMYGGGGTLQVNYNNSISWLYFDYSTGNCSQNLRSSSTSMLGFYSGSTYSRLQGLASSHNVYLYLQPGGDDNSYYLQGDGVLRLPNLSSDPTGVAGGICMVGNALHYYNGSAWVTAT